MRQISIISRALLILFAALQPSLATFYSVLDQTFDPRLTTNSVVTALETDAQQRVLVGGRLEFAYRAHPFGLVRLLSDGRMDPGFHPPPFYEVRRIIAQPDGKILVSGRTQRPVMDDRIGGILRLNDDGSLDEAFSSKAAVGTVSPGAMALHTDGTIYVADHELTSVPGALRRLHPDGSIDHNFGAAGNLALKGDGYVSGLVVEPRGAVIVVGKFSGYAGIARPSILRVLPNGQLDPGFNPGPLLWETLNGGRPGTVEGVFLHPNIRMSVGLRLDDTNGHPRSAFATLWATDGLLESHLVTTNGTLKVLDGLANPSVSVTIDPATSTLIGGEFSRLGGTAVTNVAIIPTPGSAIWEVSDRLPIPPVEVGALHTPADFLIGGSFDGTPTFPRTALAKLKPASFSSPDVEFLQQPADLSALEGATVAFPARVRSRFAPQTLYRWLHNGRPVPGAPGSTTNLTLTNISLSSAGVYELEVTDYHGYIHKSRAAILTVHARGNGSVDATFIPPRFSGATAVAGGNIIPTDDGGAYAAQSIQFHDGTALHRIVRLDPSGGLVPGFTNSFAGPPRFQLQADGKLLVLAARADPRRVELFRLDAHGAEDADYRPPLVNSGEQRPGLSSFALDPQGRALLFGRFTTATEPPRTNFVRLLPSGDVDPSFNPAPAAIAHGGADIKVLANGEIILAGLRARIAENGSISPEAFEAPPFMGQGFEPDPDGKLLLATGNALSSVDGVNRRRAIARMLPNWTSFDPDFQPVVDMAVYALDLQSNGRIIIGGDFIRLNGAAKHGLARLNHDGSLDPHFHRGRGLAMVPGGAITSVVIGADGNIWIGGTFDEIDGYTRHGLARLLGDVQPSLSVAGPRHGAITRLRIETLAGWNHRIEFRDSLTGGEWQPLRTIKGTGAAEVVEESLAEGNARFYRVALE